MKPLSLAHAVRLVRAGRITQRLAAERAGVSLGKLQRALYPERHTIDGKYYKRARKRFIERYHTDDGFRETVLARQRGRT